jgi:hypothetical protein
MSEIIKEPFIVLAGGRIRCRRCQALSTRSKEQCKKPALRGKRVCDFHGGRSTGPRTEEGKARIAKAHTIHGNETKAIREKRSRSSAYLMELEDVAWALNMMSGTRTRGRKPKNYHPVKTLQGATLWCLLEANGLRRKVKF